MMLFSFSMITSATKKTMGRLYLILILLAAAAPAFAS